MFPEVLIKKNIMQQHEETKLISRSGGGFIRLSTTLSGVDFQNLLDPLFEKDKVILY